MKRTSNIFTRFATWLLLLAASGCVTVETWDQGFPKSSKKLVTKDERLSEYRKFEVTEITTKFVKVNGVHYSRQSFQPIFAHATPQVLDHLKQGDLNTDRSTSMMAIFIAAFTSTIQNRFPYYWSVTKDVATAGTYGYFVYLSKSATDDYDDARSVYLKRLAERIQIENTL